jgi:hypothetical protein
LSFFSKLERLLRQERRTKARVPFSRSAGEGMRTFVRMRRAMETIRRGADQNGESGK